MKLTISGLPVQILGDPHLGRRFINGVPLHRRGEREAMQWAAFEADLAEAGDARLHVCVGDLFDRFIVPPEIVLRTAELYRRAAAAAPGTTFAVLMGNHDGARDAERKSSFDLFTALVTGVSNLHVIAGEPRALGIEDRDFAFVPWHPFRSAADLVAALPLRSFDAVFGHWDLDSFGRDERNLFPADLLAARTGLAITGHIHLPQQRELGPLTVIASGSMQPYAHGEDPDNRLYRTLTLDALPHQDVRDKCVRLLLRPGEEVPEDLDCLQLTVKRLDDDDASDLAVEIEAFDFQALFRNAMAEHGVNDAVAGEIWGKIQERRGEPESSS